MSSSQDWLEQRLEVVLARSADTIAVSPAPALIRPIASRPTRRHRSARWWAAAGGAALLVVSGGSIAAASLIQPHAYLDPTRTRVSPTSAAIAKAVMSALPPGGHIVRSQQVTASNASYDEAVIATNNATYNFTVYQKFSSAELDRFGVHRIHLRGGTGWIGSDTPSLRSVYFLSDTGVGVYVSESSPDRPADGLGTIENLAERLANKVPAATQPATP